MILTGGTRTIEKRREWSNNRLVIGARECAIPREYAGTRTVLNHFTRR